MRREGEGAKKIGKKGGGGCKQYRGVFIKQAG